RGDCGDQPDPDRVERPSPRPLRHGPRGLHVRTEDFGQALGAKDLTANRDRARDAEGPPARVAHGDRGVAGMGRAARDAPGRLLAGWHAESLAPDRLTSFASSP